MEAELAKVTRELDKLIDALIQGIPADWVKQRMTELETRRHDLQQRARQTNCPSHICAPNMVETYRRKVAELARATAGDTSTAKATLETIRSLIERVIVTSEGETMAVELIGELGGILSIVSGQNAKGSVVSGGPCSAQLVAGHRTLLSLAGVPGLFRVLA